MARIGYVRVSTVEQNTARQEVLMEQLGVDKVFIDKATGKNTARPELEAMLEYVREGDTLIVESFSRLARSAKDLLAIVEQLDEKKVQFISQKENVDTSTPTGKFMMTVFAAVSELEVGQLALRQKEGIALAKAAGKYKGRKPIEIDEALFEAEYKAWRAGDTSPKFMMKKLGLKPATFWRRIREYEIEKGLKDA